MTGRAQPVDRKIYKTLGAEQETVDIVLLSEVLAPLIPVFALRSMLTVLGAALLLFICRVSLAQPKSAAATAEDTRLLPYVVPGQMVDIGGRRINLHCAGAGGPTVVLMAGIASWSALAQCLWSCCRTRVHGIAARLPASGSTAPT